MTEPRCIAQLLITHQTTRPMDFTITHGKGRQGVIICQARRSGKTTFVRWLKSKGLFK